MWELTQERSRRASSTRHKTECHIMPRKDTKYRDWGWKTLLAFEPPGSNRLGEGS